MDFEKQRKSIQVNLLNTFFIRDMKAYYESVDYDSFDSSTLMMECGFMFTEATIRRATPPGLKHATRTIIPRGARRLTLGWWPRKQKEEKGKPKAKVHPKPKPTKKEGFLYKAGTSTVEQIEKEFETYIKKYYEPTEKEIFKQLALINRADAPLLGRCMKALDVDINSKGSVQDIWNEHLVDEIFTPYFAETYGYNDNLIFYGHAGEDFLYDVFMGSNVYDPSKVSADIVKKFLTDNGVTGKALTDFINYISESALNDIDKWGRYDWGEFAIAYFTKITIPRILKGIKIKNVKIVEAYDDTSWDGLLGLYIVFTDIESVVSKFNTQLGEAGSVEIIKSKYSKLLTEATAYAPPGDDPEMPKSDNKVADVLTDIDRAMANRAAENKRTANKVVNVAKAAAKPFKRTAGWVDNIINRFRDANETNIKEKMADPHARSGIFNAIKKAILAGSLFKANLLFNPIFLFLAVTKRLYNKSNEARIRADVIGQIKAELEVLDEKIEDARRANDNSAKYKMMRFKTELQKKLIRVGGGSAVKKVI
jgi:hypothetical protein